MTRHNSTPSREYVNLMNHLQDFAEEHGSNDTTRAVADGLEDVLLERFKRYYGLDKKSGGTACIGRLIAGGRCNHGVRQKGDSSDRPPHNPPHADHTDLWLKDTEPTAYTMHLYDLHRQELRDIVDFADEWGLEVSVHPGSWYFSNRTSLVVFHAPELFRE